MAIKLDEQQERLQSGEHLIVLCATVRYDLFYTRTPLSTYCLKVGDGGHPVGYLSFPALLAALIDCIGSFEPSGE